MTERVQKALLRFGELVETGSHENLVQEWSGLWPDLHQLAEGDDPALRPLLERGLEHPSWYIRSEALALLGFHYDLSNDVTVLDRIRAMLLPDPGAVGTCGSRPPLFSACRLMPGTERS